MGMTLEEAIKHAEEIADLCEYEASKYDMSDSYESHVACQEGKCAEEHRQLAEWLRDYKRLKEQEPCEDAISRQAAIYAVKKNTFRLTFAEEQGCEGHVAWSAEAVYSDVVEGALLELPSVTPQPKIGHWIYDKKTDLAVCSKCGSYCPSDNLGRIETYFCPQCKAKMVEPQESEE